MIAGDSYIKIARTEWRTYSPLTRPDIPISRKIGGRPVFSEEETEGSWGESCQPPGRPFGARCQK